jgi:hypothetical protein
MTELAYHSAIQEHLVALSELDEKVGPHELICGWFDDLYFPAEETCPKGYPQETWDRGQREWRECFSAQELAVLADFHLIFKEHVKGISQEWSSWRQDPDWLVVRDAARMALDRFRSAA